MNIKNLIKILVVLSFLICCSDENQNKNSYKKKTDLPLTGQSTDKKVNLVKK